MGDEYALRIMYNIEWNNEWDDVAMDSHFIDFLNVWKNHVISQFGGYVNAYLMATQGFWDPLHSMMHEYYFFGVVDNDLGLSHCNLFAKHGIMIEPPIQSIRIPLSPGLLFWILMGLLAIIIVSQSYWLIPCYIFIVCTSLTVMIATPLAFGMCYITPLIYTLLF